MKESRAVRRAAESMHDSDAVNNKIEAFMKRIDDIK